METTGSNMPYKPLDEVQRKTQAIKLLLRGQKYYEKNPQVLYALMQAKAHSDLGDYPSKNVILKEMIKARPEEFTIDSEKGDVIGLTHLPSNFKIHTVKDQLQGLPELLRAPDKTTPGEQVMNKRAYLEGYMTKRAGDEGLGMQTPVEQAMESFNEGAEPVSKPMKNSIGLVAKILQAREYVKAHTPVNSTSPTQDEVLEAARQRRSRIAGTAPVEKPKLSLWEAIRTAKYPSFPEAFRQTWKDINKGVDYTPDKMKDFITLQKPKTNAEYEKQYEAGNVKPVIPPITAKVAK